MRDASVFRLRDRRRLGGCRRDNRGGLIRRSDTDEVMIAIGHQAIDLGRVSDELALGIDAERMDANEMICHWRTSLGDGDGVHRVVVGEILDGNLGRCDGVAGELLNRGELGLVD